VQERRRWIGVQVRLSKPIAERLDREARALGMSSSRLLELMALRYLVGLGDARRELEASARELGRQASPP
jgi:Ribbon-helix-helix protein, copG family